MKKAGVMRMEKLIEQARNLTRIVIDDFPEQNTKSNVKAISDESADAIYTVAWTNLARKNYKEARLLFQSLVMAKPLHTDYWKGLGMTMMRENNLDQALQVFSWTAILDAQDPWPHIYACEVLIEQKKQSKAITAYNIATQLVNEDPKLKEKLRKKMYSIRLTLESTFTSRKK